MLERLKDVLRNRKDNDRGFSLVELAVVIVVIGILVAIAVPVFLGIQGSARQANVDAAAANGSAIAAGELAAGASATATAINAELASLAGGEVASVVVAIGPNPPAGAPSTLSLENYCVTATGATGNGTQPETKGPGC